MQSIVILGRQPLIGLAELESLYGATCLHPVGPDAVLLDMPSSSINYSRLGGALKLGQVLTITDNKNIKSELAKLAKQIELPQNSKITIGVSAYNLDFSISVLQTTAFSIKKIFKRRGINARVIPNRDKTLNAAQILHNNLSKDNGIEILLVGKGSEIIIARTTNVQNITDYTARDRMRPKRDAYVGMLPPKLAQIIINLATSQLLPTSTTVLDPFCGTGVILQETLLMGFDVYGSDLDKRMIDYSKTNIAWAKEKYPFVIGNVKIEVGDARNYKWQPTIDVVASETYLGIPLTSAPPLDKLQSIITEVDKLHKQFLKNIHAQLKPGTRLCLAVPAWFKNGAFLHLPTLDQLAKLGYNRVAFEHAGANDMIYHRPDQFVARELVILIRN
ncbi:MAG TPA: methyltransferase domain-containing protein [Patescibacteria group bacterium]|nr:methyltransferase domain-containing protein [Patescibacteria group bacterium]